MNQGNLKVNELAREGIKQLHSMFSLNGEFRFKNQY